MNILFITANRVGDAVLTTGLLAWLQDKYPDAKMTIACGPYGADLFVAVPQLERLIVMKKKKRNGHWVDLWRQCIGTHWDLIVDLRNSLVSRLLLSKRYARHSRSSGKHKVEDNAAVLGITPPPSPHIWLTDKAQETAASLLPPGPPILALGPAANWPPKQWPIEHFIHLVQALTLGDTPLNGARVLIIADGHEREQLTPLLEAVPPEQKIELIGRDLQTAAACLKLSRLYVGNDSGLMHLSAALGTPTLGLFGPGYPDIYGPWGAQCAFVQTPESREELLSKLRSIKAREPNLMTSLSAAKVVEAALLLLEETKQGFA